MAIELQLEGTVTGQELKFWQGPSSSPREDQGWYLLLWGGHLRAASASNHIETRGSTSPLSQSRPVWDAVLLIGEICFTSFFALDVLCRIFILGNLFWKVCLNYIDVAVSITSIVELSVTVAMLQTIGEHAVKLCEDTLQSPVAL